MIQKNDWQRRLTFVAPNSFTWAEDPPDGFSVGDRADFKIGERYYVRSINGNNVNLDDVGKTFLGYETPDDHKAKRARRVTKPVNGKWGPGTRAKCEAAGISTQTFYNRRRAGMDEHFALTATAKEAYHWRKNNRELARPKVTADDEWRKAVQWMTSQGLDKYLPPSSRPMFMTRLANGFTPKQAILYREAKHAKWERRKAQALVRGGVRKLREAMPDIQERLSVGEANEGVILAARLLGVLNMMLGSETAENFNVESVYGNLVLAMLASGEK